MHTQFDHRAVCADAVVNHVMLHTHDASQAVTGRDACSAAGSSIRTCERWRGDRNRQTPGDHATNLVATMLVLLHVAPLASSLRKLDVMRR